MERSGRMHPQKTPSGNLGGRRRSGLEFHGNRFIADALLWQVVDSLPPGASPRDMRETLTRALTQLYRSFGLFDAQISVDPVGEKPSTYSVNIEEGKIYQWGHVEVTSQTIPPKTLEALFPIKSGEVPNLVEFKGFMDDFIKNLREQGYSDCSYIPTFNYNRQTGTVDLQVKIYEGVRKSP